VETTLTVPRRELFSLTVERGSREEVRLRRIRETKVEEVRRRE
jgi:hypothetical protein